MAEHPSQNQLDYPHKVLEYIIGFRVSKAMFSACELGVFDLLLKSQRPMSAQHVAQELSTNMCATERLLEILEAKTTNGTEAEMLKFVGMMNSIWVIDGHDIVTSFNLSCFQNIVDLGGCTGALAREVMKAYPSSSVTVFDLPQVVEMAQKHFSQSNDAVVFQAGDFFSGDVPPADLYILARNLHAWPEEKSLTLLKKIYDNCKPGGDVLLVETLLFENRQGPLMALMSSLGMLVLTMGRERPASEYTQMLIKAGFLDVQVSGTGKSYGAILALK